MTTTPEIVEKLRRIQALQKEFVADAQSEFCATPVTEMYDVISRAVELSSLADASVPVVEATEVPTVRACAVGSRATHNRRTSAWGETVAAAEAEYEEALASNETAQEKEQREMINRYNLEEHLGAGAFGLVFLARSKANGETRAIKCIAKQAQDLAALENEIKVMRAASAAMGAGISYVVTLHETFEGPDHYFLVMEVPAALRAPAVRALACRGCGTAPSLPKHARTCKPLAQHQRDAAAETLEPVWCAAGSHGR